MCRASCVRATARVPCLQVTSCPFAGSDAVRFTKEPLMSYLSLIVCTDRRKASDCRWLAHRQEAHLSSVEEIVAHEEVEDGVVYMNRV